MPTTGVFLLSGFAKDLGLQTMLRDGGTRKDTIHAGAGITKSGVFLPLYTAFLFPTKKACRLPLLSCKVCPSCWVMPTTPETHEAMALHRQGGCGRLV
jgi:hypothetical protein